jgi:hypothetical protein
VHAKPRAERALLSARLGAQLLAGPAAPSTERVLEQLVAVQAQEPKGARLAIRSRSRVAAAADVDGALTDRRSAVVTWLNRGTLHLVRAEDYWWLHPITTPPVRRGSERRLRQAGLERADVERGIEIIVSAVAGYGPRTRAELKAVLDAGAVPTGGHALAHLLLEASLRGHIVRGPVRDGQPAYVAVDGWLGPAPDPVEEPEALARLARRYLVGHGPASVADLARWAGITQGRARRGLDAIVNEVVALPGERFDLTARGVPAGLPVPKLLGPFDPVLHGWSDRSLVVGSHEGVVTTNGLFRPTALVDGRVVGTWSLTDGRVRLRLLEPVAAGALRALRDDALAVLRFLGVDEVAAVVERAGRT